MSDAAHRRGGGRSRSNGLSPIVMSLLFQLYQQLDRSPYKPPVTIACLLLNLFVHLHPEPNILGHYLVDIQGNCLHPAMIVTAWKTRKQLLWHRLFLSSLIHADDMHLYYNMLSLVWKGIHLEQVMGSSQFALCVVYSLVMSHVLLVLMTYVLYDVVGMEAHASGFYSCAVGFSAVLFSLKYIWNQYNAREGNGYSNIMGISFPTQHAAWLELVLISMITPNASFLGHLAGILAGFLYMHGLVHAITFLPRHVLRVLRLLFIGGPAPDNSQTRYTYTSGFARTDATQSQRVDDEVEIELEYEEDFQPSQREEYPDSLDLRQQRLRRFNQQQQQASQRTTQSSTSRR